VVATVGSIAVAFSADLSKYQAELRKGEKRTDDFARRTSQDVSNIANNFNRLGGIVATFGRGLLAGAVAGGLGGLVTKLGEVARGVAAIGDRAKQAGLDTQSFQKLAFVADQNRIEVDDLTSGIREMQLRMDEFIVSAGKSGSAAQSLQRIGFTVDELKTKLKNPLELFTEIIGKVKQLNESARIKVFDDIFGGDGERLVRLIDEGADGIRDQIKAAEDLGIVLNEDVIAKAQEVDRQFNIIATTVSTHLKQAIVDAASALGEFIDSFRDFENQQNRTLNDKLTEIGKQRLDLENQILKVKERQDEATGFLAGAERKELEGTINSLQAKRDALAKDEERILGILNNRSSNKTTNLPTITVPAGANFSAPSTGSASAMKEQRDRAAELIEQLKIELSLVGASAQKQAEANALRRAGADATADQKQEITGLVDQIYQQNQAYERQQDALREVNETGREVFSTIIDDLKQGKNAGEIFADVISKIADRMENELLDAIFSVNSAGGGGGGNFFGTLFTLNLEV
jgi:hypothetical protein